MTIHEENLIKFKAQQARRRAKRKEHNKVKDLVKKLNEVLI